MLNLPRRSCTCRGPNCRPPGSRRLPSSGTCCRLRCGLVFCRCGQSSRRRFGLVVFRPAGSSGDQFVVVNEAFYSTADDSVFSARSHVFRVEEDFHVLDDRILNFHLKMYQLKKS